MGLTFASPWVLQPQNSGWIFYHVRPSRSSPELSAVRFKLGSSSGGVV